MELLLMPDSQPEYRQQRQHEDFLVRLMDFSSGKQGPRFTAGVQTLMIEGVLFSSSSIGGGLCREF